MSATSAKVAADHHMRVDTVSSTPRKVLIVVANPATATTVGRAPTDVTRTLDPHGIVLKAGRWYLVARTCEDRLAEELRTYRVDQILRLTPQEEHFDREPGFDLPGYWSSAVERFRAGLQQGEATIRLSPAGRHRMREVMSSAVIEAADRTATPPDMHGWVMAVVPIESLMHAHTEFLRLGSGVEILAPDTLRSRFRDTARELNQLYPNSGADQGDDAR